MGAISYNSNSLQTANIITSQIRHHSAPNKIISMAAIAYGNKSKVTNYNIPDKVIVISGQLVATGGSISAMDALEDTFKGLLVGSELNLDIEHNGSTRRYIATPEPPQIEREGDLAWGNFEVRFRCSQPFGMNITKTQLDSTTGHTSPTRVIPIALVGNAEFQYPIAKVTLVSGTQLTNQTMKIGNNSNGQVVQITRTWNPGDVLEIDPYNSLVTVNGVEVPFSGAIPSFKSGSQNMTYEDTFLTRSVDFDISQYGYWQ